MVIGFIPVIFNFFLIFLTQYFHLLYTFHSPPPQSISFKEECHLKHKDECIAAIDAKLAAYPELFDNRSSFYYEVNKIRERSDAGYNLVSLRLNEDEATVGGLLGDGMIWYPYQWCLAADDCITVGPWGEYIIVKTEKSFPSLPLLLLTNCLSFL